MSTSVNTFTCPRCGGHYFGRDVAVTDDGHVELRPLWSFGCNSALYSPKQPSDTPSSPRGDETTLDY